MDDKKLVIVFVAITLLILGGGVLLFSSSPSTKATTTVSQNAKVQTEQRDFDWGQISMKDGNVSKTFIIKNAGVDTLKLSNIKTSCHCTKAQVTINGVTSSSFGMNSVSSWVGDVPPGGEAGLQVIFDPNYHGPSGVGSVNRLVSVETNDPQNKTIEFSLTANVTR